jgi:site-specific DNA recombinase
VPTDDLEAVFYEQLRDFLLSPDDITAHLKQVDETIGQKEEIVVGLRGDLEKVSAEMDIVYRLYVEKQISSEGFGKRNRPLEERAKQIEEELPRLQAEIDLLKIDLLSSDENLNAARDLYGQWPTLSFEDKRKIVENIVERITVGSGEIGIDLYYLPSAKDVAKEQRNVMDSSLQPT